MRKRSLALLVCALLSVCMATVAAQSYVEPFRDGLDAIDQRRWTEAVRLMRAAIARSADTGERVRRRGVLFEEYVPSYFLGVALYQLNDFAGAIAAFDTAEQRGFVKRNAGYFRRLNDLRRDARAKLPSVAGGTPAATPPPAAAVTPDPPAGGSTSSTATAPPPSSAPPPAATTFATTPPGETSSSTTASTTGPVAPPFTPPPVTGSAPGAAADEGRQGAAALVRTADAAIQSAQQERRRLDAVPDLDLLRQRDPDLRRLEGQARADLDAAFAAVTVARGGRPDSAQQAIALAQRAENGFKDAQEVARLAGLLAKTELIRVAGAFFEGKYAAARAALERLDYRGSGRLAIQSRLFRAASAHALFVLGNQQDETLRREAETQVRELRRIAPRSFSPDARAFSPRFIQFFMAVR